MEADKLAVLVDEDRVAVRVFEYEAGRSAAGFVGLDAYLHTLRFQLPLKFPDVEVQAFATIGTLSRRQAI